MLIVHSIFRRPANGKDIFWLDIKAVLFLTSIQICEVSDPSVTFTSKNALLKTLKDSNICVHSQSSYIMTETVNGITQILNGFLQVISLGQDPLVRIL